MKNIRSKIYKTSGILLLGMLAIFACKDDEEVFEKTRLFSPVLNEVLQSEGNTIIVDIGKLKEAVSYTIEVSRDSFKTTDYTFATDTSYFIINEEKVGEELLWYTTYQVRATAHAADPQYDSRPSDLGSVKTKKYPSNQGTPNMQFDVTDTRARVFWSTSGELIDGVKVFAASDLRLATPLFEFDLTEQQIDANEAVIGSLSPSTTYQIAIYSGETLRGWEVYTTKPPLEFGDRPVYDLSGIENENILADTLGDIEDGAVVIIEPGRAYQANGYNFNSSVLIISGYGFTPALPLIHTASGNYDIADGASIDSLVFKNVAIHGDFGGGYVFNISVSGTIGEIKFDGCEIHSHRGITRIKGGTGTIDKYSIVNSVADSINGYAAFYVDTDGWTAGDILLQNSTFSKFQYFLASRTNTGSITIESCTIDQAPEAGRQMFRWRGGAGKNDVTGGIKIYNTIWGPGWDMSGSEVYAVKGTEGLGATTFDIINTWSPSDFSFSGNDIAGFPSFIYSGTADDLWVDRENVDYNIKDKGFSAANSAGDPRWRPGL
ncbi:DUF4957 domain-containing protein [Fulvivirga kasyanovii]|uniref:DUF5123 domain-containing protein n=1 Tax=Fulvivirga kasyanovii TaxID=396812 RepID=A0ABW9RYM6_9BACT|nr:DUF5123 domain-containing protein [Fulvivirga kasyanovii]MTI28827.1 DUF5123 domain-containing protein [Fulvivirga kasyanovii]